MNRLTASLALAGFAFLLTACVGSERPLLAEAEAIADPALSGNWSYPDGDKLERLVVTPRGKTYLISNPSEPAKKPLIATLHPYNANDLILQLRSSDRPVVQYALAARAPTSAKRVWRMRFDICNREIADASGFSAIKADRFSCTITTRAQLDKLLARAAAEFESESKKLMIVTQDASR